ncbi:hypothetical protein ACWDTT_10440 [Streptosporangium sandarakinum]
MPYRRHRELVDLILQIGQQLPEGQRNLDAFATDDLYRLVAAFSEERRILEERDKLCEEALAFFVAELKRRGEKHLAIQRRMRLPDDLPDASQITRLLRRWQPVLDELREHALTDTAPQHSAFLTLVDAARAAEEARARAANLSEIDRARAQRRASALGDWVQRMKFLRASAGAVGLLLAGTAAAVVVAYNSHDVELSKTTVPPAPQQARSTTRATLMANTAPPRPVSGRPATRRVRSTPTPTPIPVVTVTRTAAPRPKPAPTPTPTPSEPEQIQVIGTVSE